MKLLFLHGLGQTAMSWQAVREALPKVVSEALDLYEDDLLPDSFGTMKKRVTQTITEGDDVIVIGLSLGGMLALSLLENPAPQLKALVVIAGQYRLKGNMAYRLQRLLFKCFPKRFFEKQGMSKENIIQFYQGLDQFDLTEVLKTTELPILLVCGEKDKINLKTAKEMLAILPQANLEIVSAAGHELNKEQPQALANVINRFLNEISPMNE